MTARQPRRTRRRAAPAPSLPRPAAGVEVSEREKRSAAIRRNAAALHHREHHVTKDYSHVTRDLLTVTGVGTAVLGFIVAMSFLVN